MINKVLYTDGLVFMSEIMEDLKKKLWDWKEALESKDFRVNITKMVIVNGWDGEPSKSKINLCRVCGKRVMANSALWTKCGNWVYYRSAQIKIVTSQLS